MQPVAILGAAQTRHVARRDDACYSELAFEVVAALLAETGFTHPRIDTVITVSSDFSDGRTISDMAVQDAVGAAGKSSSKVSMDGAFALAYAAARLTCGRYRTCLVVAHAKASEGRPREISRAAFDPFFERPLGPTDHVALGLQARRFLARGTVTREAVALAAARALAYANGNPNAHWRGALSSREIQLGPPVADPLHRFEVAPDSDGACALLLADLDTARAHAAARGVPVIRLDAVACATDRHGLGDRDLGLPGVLPQVARAAYAQAGITDPVREIDVAEVYDASAVQTLLWREGVGLPVDLLAGPAWNPSGGALCAQPGFATGLVRVAEVWRRLAAGEGRTGLAHGMTGFVGQAHCVGILRRA
ncbi:MAG: hypothetical protein HZA54_08575 [Planctomycetes bacterium]|nr:hypothetical protein [Planctomycetota bacterium]